jgi:hypothetical protein
MNVKHCKSMAVQNPFVDVTVSRKINIEDCNGIRLQQAITHVIYQFNLSEATGVETVRGLPLKLHPVHIGRLSTFATFLPSDTTGYFVEDERELDGDEELGQETELEGRRLSSAEKDTHRHSNSHTHSDGHSDSDVNAYEFDGHNNPLLWAGAEDEVDGGAVLLVESKEGLQGISITVQAWFGPDYQMMDEVKLFIPDQDYYGMADESGVDESLREVFLQYYRGRDHYTKLNEMTEYLKAALVSFVSPFVVLGAVFSGIAFCVFVWLNYPFRQPDDLSEKGSIVLV